MTNVNYSELTNQELVDLVENIQVNPSKLTKNLKYHHQNLLKEITKRTSFLKEPDNPIFARLFCLRNNIAEHPTCHNSDCTNKVHWNKNKREFFHHCSNKCKNEDPEVQEKMKQTTLKHFGVEHAAQSKEVQQKQIETTKSRFGVEYASQTKEFRERVKQTCMKKFNAPSTFQSKEIQEKIKNTLIQKYNVEDFHEIEDFKSRQQQGWIDKYGVVHPMKSDDIKKKVKDSHIRNWGSWFSQTYMFHKLKKHKFHSDKYPGLTFDSTWEVKVYEFCKDHNIPIEYSPEISYPYEYDGGTFYYHPDFLINGKVYEVKGDHFFRVNEETGKEEMFNPYRSPKWSDEQYAWVCGKFEAKHQCMLENSIKIIRGSDMSNLDMRMFD